MSTVRNLDARIGANNCSTANTPSIAKASSTADAPSTTQTSISQTSNNSQPTTDESSSQGFQDSQPGSFVSTSDCSSLSSPYVPSLTSMALTSSNVSFNIKCDTDYSDPDADFLTVAVFTFEDCIAACASFNEVRFHAVLTTTVLGSQGNLAPQMPTFTPRVGFKTQTTFLKLEILTRESSLAPSKSPSESDLLHRKLWFEPSRSSWRRESQLPLEGVQKYCPRRKAGGQLQCSVDYRLSLGDFGR